MLSRIIILLSVTSSLWSCGKSNNADQTEEGNYEEIAQDTTQVESEVELVVDLLEGKAYKTYKFGENWDPTVFIFGEELESYEYRLDSILVKTNGNVAAVSTDNLRYAFSRDLESGEIEFLDLDFDGMDELVISFWEMKVLFIFQYNSQSNNWEAIETNGELAFGITTDPERQSFTCYIDEDGREHYEMKLIDGELVIIKEVIRDDLDPYIWIEKVTSYPDDSLRTKSEQRVTISYGNNEEEVTMKEKTYTDPREISEFLSAYDPIRQTFEYCERDEMESYITFSDSEDCFTEKVVIKATSISFSTFKNAAITETDFDIVELRLLEWGSAVQMDLENHETQAQATLRFFHEYEPYWIPTIWYYGYGWADAETLMSETSDLFVSTEHAGDYRIDECQYEMGEDNIDQ